MLTEVAPGKGFVGLPSDFGDAARLQQDLPETSGVKEKRRRITNDDLPPGTLSRYNKIFVPKLIEIVARLANPWELQVINFPGELTRLWDETFPDTELGYLVEAGTPLFELSTQRLYTWRSTVGTNAIAAVQRFWENEGISDPLDRAECAKIAIGPGKPYLFGEVEFMPDLRTIARRVNRFESPVILDALGEHLRIIDRVVKKPVAYPRGALMLAAAAAERAWKLAVADGKIVPERKDAFSEKSVGPNIKIFGNAIAQLTDAKWAQILSNARAFIVFKDAKSRSLAIDIDDDDDLYSDEEYYMKANKTSMSTIEDDADSL